MSASIRQAWPHPLVWRLQCTFTSNAVTHHSGASAQPMYAPGEHRQCCRQTTGCRVRITQSGISGRAAAQAGPTCWGHGRNGSTGANGTSIVDHIIAAHALASMASTMVRHDWMIQWTTNAPVPLGPLCTVCARSRPADPAQHGRYPAASCLTWPMRHVRKTYQVHVGCHAHTWWQHTPTADESGTGRNERC
jgi:hypothetical protein